MSPEITDKATQNAPLKTYVYALQIQTSPEKLWLALTSNEFIEKYWGGEWRFESDWQPGSELRYYQRDGQLYSVGEVLEAQPPHKLVYTWPEAQPVLTEPERLSWEISLSEPGTVKLSLIHENLSEEFFTGVSKGWPEVLASLKALLETGAAQAVQTDS